VLIDGRASLSIKSVTHPAAEVTAILGLTPTIIAERGDPVGKLRTGADGKPSMRERTSSIWVLDGPASDPDDGSGFSSVQALVEVLTGKEAQLERLRAHYFVEIAWSGFSDRPQAGFLLPAELLAALGALGCDFHGTLFLHGDTGSASESAERRIQDPAP
jgi:hypothetical protein